MKTIPKHTLDFIDSWLELRSKWEDVPGFTVAVAKGDQVLFNKSYGYADVEKKEKLTPDHLFRIASHSKTFTATAIMQLQEKKKLRIDDAVVDYLPWLKKHKDKRWQSVTVRQLLSHSAGMTRDGLESDYWQLIYDFPDEQKLREEILKADLVFEPNTKMKYSNYGFSLLGLIIKEVSGQNYNDYVVENIVKPLHLGSTTPEYDIKLNVSSGYTRRKVDRSREKVPSLIDTKAMSSATGFCSTSADLCKYFAAHLVGSGKLLNDNSKREMQRKAWEVPNSGAKEYYALGLEHSVIDGWHTIGHGGGFPGHITQSRMDPETGLIVVVLMNCNGSVGPIISSIFSIIGILGEKEPKGQSMIYEGRFSSLWECMEIIAGEHGLYKINPNRWWPFGGKEELEIIDKNTLRIKGAYGYMSDGAYVTFKRNSRGAIHEIVYDGGKVVPDVDGNPLIAWK